MPAFIDLTDDKFGRLTVVSHAYNYTGNCAHWNCICDCGKTVVVKSYNLKNGNTKSCGCLAKELSTARMPDNTTHGMSKTRLYSIWHGMKKRCYDNKRSNYKWYGGRGIKVCDRWLESFENFRDDMLPSYQDGLEIDRKDNDGNYEPSNCRWITHKENQKSRRKPVRK